MKKWKVPDTPFAEWGADYLYICFNDECPYMLRGWEVMSKQGNLGFSYRAMFNPASGSVGPMPIHSLKAMREGIVDDD